MHSRENLFLCGECGRSFPSKRHLVTHCKFHAGERPFVCEECGESFTQKDHLVIVIFKLLMQNLCGARDFKLNAFDLGNAFEISWVHGIVCLQRLWSYIFQKI